MVQYAMVVDLHKCVGCHSCAVACKSEWQVPSEFGRSWVKRLGPDKTPHGMAHTFYPGHCNHCDHPPCVAICPVSKIPKKFEKPSQQALSLDVAAIWKDPLNGTVQIDKERCTGCGACVKECPYEAIYINSAIGKNGVADKCSFCLERLAAGFEPACVATCPSEARIFGDLHDPNSLVIKYITRGAQALTSWKVGVGPNVYYMGSKKDMFLLNKTSAPQGK